MFQLVLQFDCASPEDLDIVLQIEEELISLLGDSADVDGHDVGSDEANIFIHACEPLESFKTCQTLLKRTRMRASHRAACRSLAGDACTVLHPEDSGEFRVA